MSGVHANAAPSLQSPAMTFTALLPDGTPAVSAVAVATVMDGLADGAAARPSYHFRPTSTGTFVVVIPLSDPVIRAKSPGQRLFNVRVTVYQFASNVFGGRPLAVSFLNYILNTGDPTKPRDFAGVDGSVLRLSSLPASRSAVATIPDGSVCQTVVGPDPSLPGSYTCTETTHPYDTRNEQVVIAHNIGSGVDMNTSLLIDDSSGTSTSVIAGIDGFFVEARGSVVLGNDVAAHFTFDGDSVPGGPVNEDAALLVDFMRVDTYDCMLDVCTGPVVTWLPDGIEGTAPTLLPTDEPIWHDGAALHSPTDLDCTVGIQDSYTIARGVNRQESWSFGFDFDFAGSYSVFNLHANALIQTHSVADYRNSYVWEVTGSSREFHHLFVHLGELHAAGAGSSCPINSPGSTYTDADNIKKVNPDPEADVPLPIVPPPPVQDARRTTGRCAEAPERCGHDG
jgi:hypothetical protein